MIWRKAMKCPKCESSLEKYKYKGIETDKCPNCQGMWFDFQELDDLEDKEFSIDELKGSLIYRPEDVNLKCPTCEKNLKSFQYRINDLHLEYCEDSHGFWLDSGEAERILELMDQREKDIDRKAKAEADWARMLKRFRKKSFLDSLKNLLP
jgi:Zn-finger nucleic acid-binding protein